MTAAESTAVSLSRAWLHGTRTLSEFEVLQGKNPHNFIFVRSSLPFACLLTFFWPWPPTRLQPRPPHRSHLCSPHTQSGGWRPWWARGEAGSRENSHGHRPRPEGEESSQIARYRGGSLNLAVETLGVAGQDTSWELFKTCNFKTSTLL